MNKNLTVVPLESQCSENESLGNPNYRIEEIIIKLQHDLQKAIEHVITVAAPEAIRLGISLQDVLFNTGSAIASVAFNQLISNTSDTLDLEDHPLLINELLKALMEGYKQKVDLLLAPNRDVERLIVMGSKIGLH